MRQSNSELDFARRITDLMDDPERSAHGPVWDAAAQKPNLRGSTRKDTC